jgi:hypothetical protein
MSDNDEPCYCINGTLGGHARTIRCAEPAYPAFAMNVARARESARPDKSSAFRCAICDDGLRTCSCSYGHHNAPIRTQADTEVKS